MMLLITLSFLGIITGCFIIMSLSPFEFANGLFCFYNKSNQTIKSKIDVATSKSKEKRLRRIIRETKEILEITNQTEKFSLLCMTAFALFIVGVLISAAINNLLLIPVLAFGLSLLPFWYVKFTATFYKKNLNSELEVALSVVTTSYLRSESILTAIEENVSYINPPISDVFRSFLIQTKLINSNIKLAVDQLKSKVDNEVFKEWCDAIIACQEDKNFKSTLTPIVSKLSDIRVVSAELDYLLYEPMKEVITMAVLLISNIPLMYFLNKDWYKALMTTFIGKSVLAYCILVLFISLGAVIKLTRPIEYKR